MSPIARTRSSLSKLLLLLIGLGAVGCSGPSVLDEPGVTLPESPPLPDHSKDVVDLNNQAFSLMFKDPQKAMALLDQALTRDPTFHPAQHNKVNLLTGQMKFAEALVICEHLGQIRPRMPENYIMWAYCLDRLGRQSESRDKLRYAIAAYNAFLKEAPDDTGILLLRARACFLFGERSRARQELDRIVELDSQFSFTRDQMLEAMNRSSSSSEYWTELFE